MRIRILSLLLLAVPAAAIAQPKQPSALALRQYLFVLDLQGTALDEFPSSVKALNGVMTVVDKNGQHMLMASSPSELLITLPQLLPSVFTVEVDLVPKGCCNPEDFMLEGTPTRNRGVASAELTWHPAHIMAVGGGGEMYQSDMPADLAASTPGNLTQLVFEFNGSTIKLYTNGRRLYTLDKQFVRGRVLRVWLGGESATNPMYLAGLRVGSGPAGPGVTAASGGQPSALSQQSNPLPTVKPTQQQTASSSQGLTGGPTPTFVANVSVTQGSAGPVVTWQGVAAPATYTVKRWMSNDLTCCNNASGNLTGPPWQDVQPPLAGTYVYEVTVTTNGGTATGQAQFVTFKQGGQIANTGLAPAPSSGPRTVSPTSTTPTINPPPGAASGSVASGFTVTVTMGPQGPVVSWPLVPNATGYTVTRSKSDDLNCCNTSSGRTWGATSPWQDGPLPMPGTYVYTVLANTVLGQMQAQTQYTLAAPVTAVLVTPTTTGTITPMPAPVTGVVSPTPTTTGTITPTPAPAPTPISPGSTATGGTVLTPRPPAGTTSTNTGEAPSYVGANLSPVKVELVWSPPRPADIPPWSGTYEVRRRITGQAGGSWTLLTPVPIGGTTVADVPPDRTQSYTYEVTAIDPNGARGVATVDVTLPAPMDPSWFAARAIGPDEVELTWARGLLDVKDYFLTGPGFGNGQIVNATSTGGAHNWLYTVKGIPAGTHTWTVAADYQPGGILTPQSAWPKATLNMAASGNYAISVESVVAGGMAVDDIFNGDGLGNEIFVTALVRVKDQAGNVTGETSHRSAIYGDVSNWPLRVRAGGGKPSGGIYSGDVITPIWKQPTPGATGYSRLSLWTGRLTAGQGSVEIAPVVWESDDPTDNVAAAYSAWLRTHSYTLLDLNARTYLGEISNVMLSSEGVGQAFEQSILVPNDRPIGVAKVQDPLVDWSYWYPFGIRIDQAIAEAALGGSYGAPGLISIVIADHKINSRDTFSHPDLGGGRYVLNIRVTRLP